MSYAISLGRVHKGTLKSEQLLLNPNCSHYPGSDRRALELDGLSYHSSTVRSDGKGSRPLGAGELRSGGDNTSLTAGVGRRTAIDTSVG
jgi:hypothetical protein